MSYNSTSVDYKVGYVYGYMNCYYQKTECNAEDFINELSQVCDIKFTLELLAEFLEIIADDEPEINNSEYIEISHCENFYRVSLDRDNQPTIKPVNYDNCYGCENLIKDVNSFICGGELFCENCYNNNECYECKKKVPDDEAWLSENGCLCYTCHLIKNHPEINKPWCYENNKNAVCVCAQPCELPRDDDEEEKVVVKKIVYNGKKYLKSNDDGEIYDYESYVKNNEVVSLGFWNNETQKIDFNSVAINNYIDERLEQYNNSVLNLPSVIECIEMIKKSK